MDFDLDEIFEQSLIRPPWEYMNNIRNSIKESDKDSYLQQAIDENNIPFIEGLYKGLNPMYRMEFDIAPYKDSTYGFGFSWKQLLELDTKIVSRKIPFSARADHIKAAMEDSNSVVWNEWYRYVLNKNFKAGISYKRFNSIIGKNNLKEWHIDSFYPQMSHECVSRPHKIPGNKIIDYITPGERITVLASPDSDAIAMSYNGTYVNHLSNTIIEYTDFAHQFLKEPMIFDGEIMSEEYHYLRNKGFLKKNIRLTDAVHYVYDVVPWKEYVERYFEQPLASRRETLEKLLKVAHMNNFLPNTKLNDYISLYLNPDTGEGMQELRERFDDAALWGYQGLMLKDPDMPYKCYRSPDWLSMKHKVKVVLQIDKFIQQDNTNKIKSLFCKGLYDNFDMRVNVGRGMNNETKKWLWKNRYDLINADIEILGSSITEPNKYKPYFSMKNPTFSRVITNDQDNQPK